jgi:hypothetical protein
VNGLLCDQFPRLFSFALDEDINVAELAHAQDLSSKFYLPVLVQAYEELHQILSHLDALVSGPRVNDSRIFPWGNSIYTSVRYYNFVFEQAPKDPTLQIDLEIKKPVRAQSFCVIASQ